MSIEREGGKVYIACDSCGDTSDPGNDFTEAMSTAKEAGYRSVKLKEEWVNLCADCHAERAAGVRK